MLSAADQQIVQNMIDGVGADERQEFRQRAEEALSELNYIMGKKLLSAEENNACELAIEMLVRLEATEKGKGWLFRTKRRAQLVQMYLGT